MALVNQGGKLLLTNGVLASGAACCCGCGPCSSNCTGTVTVAGQEVKINNFSNHPVYPRFVTVVCVQKNIDPPWDLYPDEPNDFWHVSKAFTVATAFTTCRRNEVTGRVSLHLQVNVGSFSLPPDSPLNPEGEAAWEQLAVGQELLNLNDIPFGTAWNGASRTLRYQLPCDGGDLEEYSELPAWPDEITPPFECWAEQWAGFATPIIANITCGDNPLP